MLTMWGHQLDSEQDIWNVFYCYLSGEPNKEGHKVNQLPWSEDELSPETNLIGDKLVELNKRGILTINSQPNVNGVDSTDPVHGWGEPGGYVYQKVRRERVGLI